MKKYYLFLVLLILTALFLLVFLPHASYEILSQKVQIVSGCKNQNISLQNTHNLPLFSYSQNGQTIYSHQFYDFTFTLPGNSWVMSQNTIQQFEQELAYPIVAYSINFSSPTSQTNITSWEEGQKADLAFLVFPNDCQPNATWFNLLPQKDTLSQHTVFIGNVAAIEATSTVGHNIAYVLFNQGNWHYEFYLQVKEKGDFQNYLAILDTAIHSFSHFQQSVNVLYEKVN